MSPLMCIVSKRIILLALLSKGEKTNSGGKKRCIIDWSCPVTIYLSSLLIQKPPSRNQWPVSCTRYDRGKSLLAMGIMFTVPCFYWRRMPLKRKLPLNSIFNIEEFIKLIFLITYYIVANKVINVSLT